MKILAPLSNIDHYQSLVEAGADELFCGYLPFDWLNKYKNITPLNRRELIFSNQNIRSIDSLKILRKQIENFKIPVKITLNSHYYNPQQYPELVQIINKIKDIGFDTFIIADFALLVYLKEQNVKCNIHLSGDAAQLNRISIDYYNQYGIKRYIFPRKTEIFEMESCIKNCNVNDMEFEAFLLNELCYFSGSYCNTIHNDGFTFFCQLPYRLGRIRNDSNRFKAEEEFLKMKFEIEHTKTKLSHRKSNFDSDSDNYHFAQFGCGVCRIKELINIGITNFKVVGRGDKVEILIKDLKIVKQLINHAFKELDNKKFTHIVREKCFNNNCPTKCYYTKSLDNQLVNKSIKKVIL